MARDITARFDMGNTVRIKLPRISIEVSRRHAERLRDALNAILPERIENLMHDPRVTDLSVLRAAHALLAERHQDTENLAVAIDHIEREGEQQHAPAAPVPDRLYLLCMWGDVDPQVCGPYRDEQERLEAAQDSRRAHGEDNGLFRVDANGSLRVSSFTGGELEMPPARRGCTLCNCGAAGERFGLPVCTYHLEHTEDDPQCPKCMTADQEQLEDGRQLLRELRDMPAADATRSCERCGSNPAPYRLQGVALCQSCDELLQAVAVGDRVRDPLDGTWREIVRIDGIADGGTCHMRDGGCMSVAECVRAEKRLPSEALD